MYRSLLPGKTLISAEQEPEPNTWRTSFFLKTCSRSSKSPSACIRLPTNKIQPKKSKDSHSFKLCRQGTTCYNTKNFSQVIIFSGHFLALQLAFEYVNNKYFKLLARVFQSVDNTIYQVAWFVLLTLTHWLTIYPLSSNLQSLNNWGL